jgi:hypothetical protein
LGSSHQLVALAKNFGRSTDARELSSVWARVEAEERGPDSDPLARERNSGSVGGK